MRLITAGCEIDNSAGRLFLAAGNIGNSCGPFGVTRVTSFPRCRGNLFLGSPAANGLSALVKAPKLAAGVGVL